MEDSKAERDTTQTNLGEGASAIHQAVELLTELCVQQLPVQEGVIGVLAAGLTEGLSATLACWPAGR